MEQTLAYTLARLGGSRLPITLPSIRWGLLYGGSLTFARCIGEFGAVLSHGGERVTEPSTLFIFRSLADRTTLRVLHGGTARRHSFIIPRRKFRA